MPRKRLTPLVRVGDEVVCLQIEVPAGQRLNAAQFEELWRDVRASPKVRNDTTEDGHPFLQGDRNLAPRKKIKTYNQDPHFSPTTLKDVYECVGNDQQGIEMLDNFVPRKIVDRTRDQVQDCVRSGRTETGCKLLEEGLTKLREEMGERSHADSRPWKFGMAELYLDQGRKKEARAILPDYPGPTRGEVKAFTQGQDEFCRTGADHDYDQMQKLTHAQILESELDIYRRAEDYDKAIEAAQRLYKIEPDYFDLKKPMDRFKKVRRILLLGLLKEKAADRENCVSKRSRLLQDALEIYNHGCYAAEIYHEFLDKSNAVAYGFDHSDTTNIFFSAARICALFDKEGLVDPNGRDTTPLLYQCKGPPLTEEDWKHQAFHFLEQGRARALFASINRNRGAIVNDFLRRLIEQRMIDNMATIADAAVRSIKRHGSMISTASSSRAHSMSGLASRPENLQSSIISTIRNGKIASKNAGQIRPLGLTPTEVEQEGSPLLKLQTTNLADSALSSPTNSPGVIETPMETEQEIYVRMKARMRWRKGILYGLSKVNSTLGTTIRATLPESIRDMRASIPKDTLVVEYALASSSPSGLMTLVIAQDGVKAVEWQTTNAVDIQNCIAQLRASMASLDSRMRESRPPLTSALNSPPSELQRRASAVHREELVSILRNAVVTPVTAHLQGKKQLVIVPSGDLAHVPWSILFDLPITVAPSLNIWSHLQTQAKAVTPRIPKLSVVSNAPTDREQAERNMPSLRDIPYSRIEALYIARLHDQPPFLADDKDREAFEALAKDTHILHICAHSTFNADEPMSSSIQLFKGSLTMRDWRKLSIQADLVVFSSCLSGISKAYDSGSTIGFSHTLLGTGTRAFIGSLWPVDDAATLLLMIMFYEELRAPAPLPAAAALYNAQKRMQTLTGDDLHAIIDELEETAIDTRADEYVINPEHYVEQLRGLKAEELHEERYWAAFVLTGYGSGLIYPDTEDNGRE